MSRDQLQAYFMGFDPRNVQGPILGQYHLAGVFVDARIAEYLNETDPRQ